VTPAWKVSDLVATTYTPKVFSQGPVLQAPLEALFPTLAASGFAAFQSWAGSTSKPVQDSLAERSVSSSTMDSLKRGLPVFRPIRSGDAVWYIRSQENVAGLDGSSIQRDDRAYLAPQTLDRPVFGGILAFQRFDSTRARILDPITQTLDATLGKKSFTSTDSARYYQKGQWRSIDFTDAYAGKLTYWPDQMQIKNLDIGYTGLNVFYSYAMDTTYAAHLRGLSNASNSLGYSNISGGTGYFSGAAADSVSIYVQSPTSDTFAVADLRHAYCYNRVMRLVDSLQKAHVTDTATAYAVWLTQRPGQCSDFTLPQH
jgi:hypothetical protein